MRIRTALQAFLAYGLPTAATLLSGAVRLAIVVGCAVCPAPRGLGELQSPEEEPKAPPATNWIEALGASDWALREESTQRLLEMGREAVPWIRASIANSDPEVRQRLRWLLSVLDPVIQRVRIVQVGEPGIPGDPPPPTSEPVVRQWIEFDLLQDRSSGGVTTNVNGQGRRVTAVVAGESSPHRVWVSFADDGEDVRDLHSLAPGEIAILRFEDRFELDLCRGRVARDLRSSVWLVWLVSRVDPNLPESEKLASLSMKLQQQKLTEELLETCRRQATHSSPKKRHEALHVAEHWGRADLAPKSPGDTVSPGDAADEIPRLLVRTRAGESSARAELEQWLQEKTKSEDQPSAGAREAGPQDPADLAEVDQGNDKVERPKEDDLAHRATRILAELGSETALEKLVSEISDMQPWAQYRGMLALNRFLERRADATTKPVLDMIVNHLLEPDVFIHLPWNTYETALLLQTLRDRTPEHFRSKFEALLGSGTPAREIRSGFGGTRPLIAAFLQLREKFEIPTELWFENLAVPLVESSGYSEEGLCLARDAYLTGGISPELWSEVMAAVERVYRSDNIGGQNRLENVMRSLVQTPGYDADQIREMWRVRLASYDAAGYLPSRIDRELVDKFGALDQPAPGAGKDLPVEPWQERREEWESVLEAATDDNFSPLAPTDPDAGEPRRVFRLVEAHFRVDEAKRDARLLAFESREMEEGVAYPSTGPSGEERTRRVRPLGTNQSRGRQTRFDIATGRYLVPGQPSLTGTGGRDTYMERFQRDDQYGARTAGQRRVQYLTLYLLDDADQIPELTEWVRVLEKIGAALEQEEERGLTTYLDIVGRLNLKTLLPILQQRFTEDPSADLARALLRLGDDRGLETLRGSIDPKRAREAISTLVVLIDTHDEWAIDRALTWLEDPPRTISGQLYNVLDALDRLTQLSNRPPIDVPRLQGALIRSLDQRYLAGKIIPILRRQTGIDFGYYDTFSITDRAQQQAAQQESIQRWRDWWAQTSGESSQKGAPR